MPGRGPGSNSRKQSVTFQLPPRPVPGGTGAKRPGMWAPGPLAPLRASFARDTAERHVPRGLCEQLRREGSPHFIFSGMPFLTSPAQPRPGWCVCVCETRLSPARVIISRQAAAGVSPRWSRYGRPVPGETKAGAWAATGAPRRGQVRALAAQLGSARPPSPPARLGRGCRVLLPPRGALAGFSQRVLPFTLNALLGDCFPFPLVCLLLAS